MRSHNLLLLAIVSCAVFSSCAEKVDNSAAPKESANAFTMETIRYVPDTHDSAHEMDLYIPKNARKPMPVVLWIHGGAWQVGSKDDTPAPLLMDDGFAVASINYRLSQQATFPAQIFDTKAAVRFLRANADKYGIDPKRVGVFGNSAGGHLAALLGTSNGVKGLEGKLGNLEQSSNVQAVVDWCGPTDFLTIGSQGGRYNQMRLDDPEGPVSKLFGGMPATKKQLAVSANPITYIDEHDPPFLIMHGEKDTVVPIQQSKSFYKELNEHKVPANFQVVKDSDHDIFTPSTLQVAEDFLKKTLH
ncbi:MAG TPA: alpha/beta hydrolase [Drouetiella sp.]